MFSIQKSREKGAFAHGAEHLTESYSANAFNLFFLTQNSSKSREKKQREKLFISLIKTVDFEKFFDRVTKTRKQQIKKLARKSKFVLFEKKT